MDVESLPKGQKIVAGMVIDLFGTNHDKRRFALEALAYAFAGKAALARQRLNAHFGRAEQSDIRTICGSQFVAL